jgi:hypothetical protein
MGSTRLIHFRLEFLCLVGQNQRHLLADTVGQFFSPRFGRQLPLDLGQWFHLKAGFLL